MSRIATRILARTAFLLCLLPAVSAAGAAPINMSAEEATKRLLDGNQRFVANEAKHAHQDAQRRIEVAKGQRPFAIIVGCSDSRVGPEVVFDQGLGDIFVIRTAGHVVDDVGLGSIEYAVDHLGAPLILVLGHEHCGAVTAAMAGGEAHGHLQAVVKAIRPAVEKVKGQPGDAMENAVESNVRAVVEQLQNAGPILKDRVKTGKLKIVGAIYQLDDGRVKLLD